MGFWAWGKPRMALIPCWECGHQISDSAGACPNCGAPARVEAHSTSNESPSNLLGESIFDSLFRQHTSQKAPDDTEQGRHEHQAPNRRLRFLHWFAIVWATGSLALVVSNGFAWETVLLGLFLLLPSYVALRGAHRIRNGLALHGSGAIPLCWIFIAFNALGLLGSYSTAQKRSALDGLFSPTPTVSQTHIYARRIGEALGSSLFAIVTLVIGLLDPNRAHPVIYASVAIICVAFLLHLSGTVP